MDSFGKYLSRERELRGVTLEEISKTSNISITFLKALENDDYDNLPAEVFVKGFLRCYAESTGMDYNEVRLAHDSFIAKRRVELGIARQPIKAPKNYSLKLFSFLAIIALVFVSSFLVFYSVEESEDVKSVLALEDEITRGGGEEEEVKKDAEKNTDILSQFESAEDESLMQTEDIAVQPQEEEITDKETLPPAFAIKKTQETRDKDILTLSMKAREQAWINLVIDDNEVKEALLLPGETVHWKAREKFVVTLGNVRQTSLKLNKKDIILPDAPENVLRDYVITRDNIKEQ